MAQLPEVSPWLLFPAGFPVVTLFCFNFIGDGSADALDPKDRAKEYKPRASIVPQPSASNRMNVLEVNDSCYVRYA